MSDRLWVNDLSRLCRITVGEELAQEAIRDGFREVTRAEQDIFRAITQQAKANGWHSASRKSFGSYLTKGKPA